MVSTFTSPQRVEEELYALCKTTSSLSNPKKDEQVCRFLETSFSEIFSGCKAIPFGSRVSGLAFPDSDLDVFLDTGNK
jgi:DNA polymerase sigma